MFPKFVICPSTGSESKSEAASGIDILRSYIGATAEADDVGSCFGAVVFGVSTVSTVLVLEPPPPPPPPPPLEDD